MPDWVFTRTVPAKFTTGLETGTYQVSGNLIKETTGKNQIVGQLIPMTTRGCEMIASLAPTLLAATTALGAANLIVSIAGFRKISRQLEGIAESIEDMKADIRLLLEGQTDILNQFENFQMAKLRAGMRGIKRALADRDSNALKHAILAVDEAGMFYQHMAEKLLTNAEGAYHHPETVKQAVWFATGSGVAVAQSRALDDRLPDAIGELEELDQWLSDYQKAFRTPFENTAPAKWLGNMKQQQVDQVGELIGWQADAQTGVRCLHNQYRLCHEQGRSVRELTDKHPRTNLLVAVRRETRKSKKKHTQRK